MPSLWTETSRTYIEPDGTFQATIYPDPVNYQDSSGDYVPISDKLVPSDEAGYDVENRAGPYTVELPANLSDAPVSLTSDNSSVSLALQGADATGDVSRTTDTYDGALNGVNVTYTAVNTGVQETTTLTSPSAPSSLTYSLDTSADLTPETTDAGGLRFVDYAGTPQLLVPPPVVQDASGVAGPATMAISSSADAITVSVDESWLQSPDRTFPVTIDPSITITGATQDCYIAGGTSQDTKFCSPTRSSVLKVGYDSASAIPYRSLLLFNLSSIPSTSTVENAQLALHLSAATTSTATSVAAMQILPGSGGPGKDITWTTQANWKLLDGTHAWTTPGGDIASTPAWTTTNVGPAVGWYNSYPTQLVQGWVNGTTENKGVLLKEPTENVNQVLSFDSSTATSSTVWPTLTVIYRHWLGEQPYQPMWSHGLTGRMGMSVDVADGNLILHANDLNIAGTGLGLSLDRYYNSEAEGSINIGNQWELGTGAGIKLTVYTGSIGYRGADGTRLAFIQNPDGSFASPAGIDATLAVNGNGYTMTFHQSGLRYNFGSNGKLTSQVDKNGNQITFAYTGTTLNSITDTQGRVTNLTYNAAGFISLITDPSGRTYQYGYDASNNLTSYTDPMNGLTTYGYDSQSNLTLIIDPRGTHTTITYASGGVSTIQFGSVATGHTMHFTYSTGHTAVLDTNNHTTTFYFDGAGRQTQVVDPLSDSFSATWSADNWPTSTTDALTHTTPYTYDANNNLTRQVLATGATTTWAYTDAAHPYSPTSTTDPQGNSTTYAYNGAGDLTSVVDGLASNNSSSFAYNPNGTMASLTDAMGHVTTYGYDNNGNLTTVTPPAPLGQTTMTYDNLSRVATTTDGLGHVTTFTYDALDRLTQVAYQGGMVVSNVYDADGNLTSETDPNGTTSYVYNTLNQQTQKTPAGGTAINYTWDGENNLLTIADAGGTTTYVYNADNLATSVTDPAGQTTFTYNADQQETARTYPNGIKVASSYDISGRLTQIQNKNSGGTVLLGYTYSYANTGGTDTDLWQKVTNQAGAVTNYTFDPLNRLLEAKTGTTPDYKYTYDGAGNRLTQNVNGTVTNYTYNAANELTTAGSTTYTFDALGERTGDSGGGSLSYNNASQTTSITPPGGSATAMSYAGSGQAGRTAAGTTTFVTNILGISSETTAGQTIRYTRDPSGNLLDERMSTGNFYYSVDGLGSVVGLTNSTGQLVNTYTYDPYGNQVSSTGTTTNHWKFAAGYFDQATGLYKFGERYYDPVTGRWTQPDPIPGSQSDPETFDRYVYAADNPINFSDPSGELLPSNNSGGGHWQPQWQSHWSPRWTPQWHPHPVLPSSHHSAGPDVQVTDPPSSSNPGSGQNTPGFNSPECLAINGVNAVSDIVGIAAFFIVIPPLAVAVAVVGGVISGVASVQSGCI
ncbi:MAG: DNRLRE domain-containing protein [Actinomycetota bacterium]